METTTTSHSHSHGQELSQKCPKIISKLSSTTTTTTNMNSSFRVYYGRSAVAAIPFMWESTPGTPKHALFSNSSLPPLTPPPSYHGFNSNNSSKSSPPPWSSMKKNSRHNLLYTIFPGVISRKKKHGSSPLSSSSMSSSPSYSSSSSFNSLNLNFHGRYSGKLPKSPIYFGVDVDQEEHEKAFGVKRGTHSDGFRGCFRWPM